MRVHVGIRIAEGSRDNPTPAPSIQQLSACARDRSEAAAAAQLPFSLVSNGRQWLLCVVQTLPATTHTPILTETSPVMPFSELSVSCPAFALCFASVGV